MASKKTVSKFCDSCARTGILSATLVKNPDTFENEKILVKVCHNHVNSNLSDKNLKALASTGIPIELVEEPVVNT